jgi:hypothetical protein
MTTVATFEAEAAAHAEAIEADFARLVDDLARFPDSPTLAELAELFDDATNTVRTLASDLRIPLPVEFFGPGCYDLTERKAQTQ